MIMIISVLTNGHQLLSTAGCYYIGSNISLSWSLGESVFETFSNISVVLSQGFQQPSFTSSQLINIPAGWSGISSYVVPAGKAVNGIFTDIEPRKVILQSMTGVYWPSQGTNTLSNWNYKEGCRIRMTAPATLEINGFLPASKSITLADTWSLMPVLSSCVMSTDISTQVSGQLVIAKDVPANGVHWPAYGINTLQTLSPGKAYFVKMTGSASLTFPGCDLKNSFQEYHYQPVTLNPWNEPERTPSSHMIAVPVSGFTNGDIVGVSSSSGICCGLVEITRKDGYEALTVFGDEPQEKGFTGIQESDAMIFRFFPPSVQKEFSFNVEYDLSLPNRDLFADRSRSAIEMFTLSFPGVNQQFEPLVSVLPNPNNGSFNLKINNVIQDVEIAFNNAQGQEMYSGPFKSENHDVSHSFEFQNLPKGLYLLKVQTNEMIKVEMVVVNYAIWKFINLLI